MDDNYMYYDQEAKVNVNIPVLDNGNVCGYSLLKDGLFRQAAAYASMKRDLNDCIETLKILSSDDLDKMPQIVKSSLMFSLIVKYVRLFNSGKGRGVSLNRKDVIKPLGENLSNFHDSVVEIRNTYLAHAGDGDYETRAIALILNPEIDDKKILKTRYTGFSLKDDEENIEKYIELIESVHRHVDEKINEIRKLVQEEVGKLDIEEIYENAYFPKKEELVPFDVNRIQ